jgi:transketolase
MRKTFAKELYKIMKRNKKIYFLVGDLGAGIFDEIKKNFSHRFINCGAAEQSMVGIAVGLSLNGFIPIVYSITPFLIFRPYEFLRVLVSYDKTNVKLIGSGRNEDYSDHNFTHMSKEDKMIMHSLKNIRSFYPKTKEEIPNLLKTIIKYKGPCYINLKRH